MLMEPSHYLDWEVLKYSNYPEVKTLANELGRLDEFFLTVNSAIAAYVEGNGEKVYLDMNDVHTNVELCRHVLDIMGTAENPCFDIIMNLRVLLEECYELVYLHRRFGSMYIEYNISVSTEVGGGEPFGS